jgi:hypothetical protein
MGFRVVYLSKQPSSAHTCVPLIRPKLEAFFKVFSLINDPLLHCVAFTHVHVIKSFAFQCFYKLGKCKRITREPYLVSMEVVSPVEY